MKTYSLFLNSNTKTDSQSLLKTWEPTSKKHMQKQDFRQNPYYFQGLSCLENIEVWKKDWVTVKFKWSTIISYPHVLPSAETDAEHIGALGSLQAVEKRSSAPNAAITQERGTVTRNKNVSSGTRQG